MLLILSFPSFAHADLPQLLPEGTHKCKVSKEYKLRECKVTKDGPEYILNFNAPGHLLRFVGHVHPADFTGKDKRVFVEARIQDEQPFMCKVKDSTAMKACKEQTVMIELKRKSSTRWVGSVPVKYYWDKYVGEGKDRRVDGHVITVETFLVELRVGKPEKKRNRENP
jgi:hypothetical protein